jgi:prepilin peptidase CpaA
LNFERNISVYLCLTVLAIALAIDVVSGRIPRYLSIAGLVLSQIYALCSTGSVTDAMYALICGIMVPVILYPLFAIGGLGAGDIKLMMMLPGFMGIQASICAIMYSFVFCAAIGTTLLIIRGNMLSRLTAVKNYITAVRSCGKLMRYEAFASPGKNVSMSNRIHFTIPLLTGVIFTYGGYINR